MTDILLYTVLGLQFVGLILISIVWRRQNSGRIAALTTTCEGLEKGQERLETLVRDEMAGNRLEVGEQARVAREEMGTSAGELTEQFAIFQRENLMFREQLGERFSANLSAFATDLIGQIEGAGADNRDEAVQLRGELFKLFNDFGAALTRQMTEATGAQDRRFAQFEERLVAVGERNADQIHSMDDAISERLDGLQLEASKNWDAKRIEDNAVNKEARLELHEALERLSAAVAKNFSVAGEAQRGQFDSFAARMNAIAASAD